MPPTSSSAYYLNRPTSELSAAVKQFLCLPMMPMQTETPEHGYKTGGFLLSVRTVLVPTKTYSLVS